MRKESSGCHAAPKQGPLLLRKKGGGGEKEEEKRNRAYLEGLSGALSAGAMYRDV